MNKHPLLYIPLILIQLLTGCSFGKQTIDAADVPITELPYSIGLPETGLSSHHNLSSYVQEILENSTTAPHLDRYFSKGTLVNYPFISYNNIPNPLPGRFFRRLPPKDGFELFLFSYFDKGFGADGMSKIPFVELQIFNPEGNLSDRMIIYGGVLGWESWIRTFSIDENYILTLYSHYQKLDMDEDSEEYTITKQYMINETGRIVDYYPQSDGIVEECVTVDFLYEPEQWYSKGKIINHLKQDEWIDYCYFEPDPVNKDNESWTGHQVKMSYVDGIPVSEAISLTPEEIEQIPCRSKE